MIQIYNDNIKRPKPQDIPLKILKIYAFYWKIQQERVLLELRSISLWEYNQQLSGSRKGVVGA